ncbi:MAG: hypothetical protein ACREE7_01170 [Dongiaceae bacterium]
MSSNVIPFRPRAAAEATVPSQPETIERLSEDFLKRAVAMHADGESGADIYMGMIMALCTLVCRSEDDPAVVQRKLAASYVHMREAQQILAAALARQ